MRRAIALAKRGEGRTRPNPPVGAVVVRNGRIVGEGWHRKAGGPHAEVFALCQAGKRAAGATLYVTLEPCSTRGRTPPCTDAILASGIQTVVAAVRDPNPAHAGRGFAILRRRGVQVREGACGAEATELVRPFASWVLRKRPFVTLKLGTSLDGRIADRTGRARWITGPEARRRVQDLRRRVDAVMVGRGTAEKDNPSLLPRPARGARPWRIIVAGRRALSLSLQVLNDRERARTIVVMTRPAPRRFAAQMKERGVSIVEAGATGGRVDVAAMLKQLGQMGVLHILCEGGGELAAELIRRGLVDELVLFVSPCVLGASGTPAVGGHGWLLGSKPEFDILDVERAGADVCIRGRPRRG